MVCRDNSNAAFKLYSEVRNRTYNIPVVRLKTNMDYNYIKITQAMVFYFCYLVILPEKTKLKK